MFLFQSIRKRLQGVQGKLNYDNWSLQQYPLFATTRGIGRIALTSCILGILLGIHLIIWIYTTINIILFQSSSSSSTTDQQLVQLALWQWSTYICCFCCFHLLEFFITVVWNPNTATNDSFLINHSTAYTAAALSSWIEFIIRQFILFYFYSYRSKNNTTILNTTTDTINTTTTTTTISGTGSTTVLYQIIPRLLWYISISGLFIVIVAQLIRTVAMITAGQSFDHHIQTSRKATHVLVTHGIYSYIRHPSYTGFFFWCIGTQFILGNTIHILLYTIASYHFFTIRIAYEEESLCKLFANDYQSYVQTTYSGIPFIYTKIIYNKNNNSNKKQ